MVEWSLSDAMSVAMSSIPERARVGFILNVQGAGMKATALVGITLTLVAGTTPILGAGHLVTCIPDLSIFCLMLSLISKTNCTRDLDITRKIMLEVTGPLILHSFTNDSRLLRC